MILLPRYFSSQPAGPVEIDWGNPLTKGLVGAWIPSSANGLLGGNPSIVGSVITTQPDSNGVAWRGAPNTASNNYVRIERGPFNYTTEVTFEALVRPHSFNSTTAPYLSGIISQWQYDTAGAVEAPGPFLRFGLGGNAADRGRLQFGVQTGVSNFRSAFAPAGSTVEGVTYHVVGVFAPGGTLKVFINGRLVGTGSAFSTTFNNSAANYISLLSDFSNSATTQNRSLNGSLFLARIYRLAKTDQEVYALSRNPWQIFRPQRLFVPVQVSGAVTHATTGVLTGPGSTVTGTAARTRQHLTTGVLTGPGSTVAGTAARTRQHLTTGALTGPGSLLSGAAARFRAFATSGALTGQGSVLSGAAARFRAFNTVGVLTGPGSVITGDAAVIRAAVTHATTGALIGPGALLDGVAKHISLYPDPSDVREGVQYGPGGIYTGTLTPGGGSTIIRLRSFTERH